MPHRTSSPPRWRGLLLAANALAPVPTLVLLFLRHPAAGWMLAGTLCAHGLLLWAIMAPRARWLGPVTDGFAAREREIWLTIDDGPDEKTRDLSATLHQRGVRATFFVIGRRLRAHPGIVEVLQSHGHTLANHTANHPREFFWCSREGVVRREVNDGQAALREAGVEARWFRPPVGHKPPALHGILREGGLRLITWTVGGRDGWSADPKDTVQRIRAKAAPGAIVVLHECRGHSHATILAVVDALLTEGFQFVIPTEEMLVRPTGESLMQEGEPVVRAGE